MNYNDHIEVMITSRNDTKFDGVLLSETRKELKKSIEKEKLFGKEIFKVWINEKEPPQSFDEYIWDKCLKEIRRADIVIVLYNGESGWLRPTDTLGICHAEVLEAVNCARGKVWSIPLENHSTKELSKNQKFADSEFEKFMNAQELFSLAPLKTIKTLKTTVKKTLNDAAINLVKRGVRDAAKNKGNHGEALKWQNMNYDVRSQSIIKSLQASIESKGTGSSSAKNYFLEFEGYKVLVTIHAIPDTLSIPNAKEKVGQPFLQDFMVSDVLMKDKNIIGPIHVIGCHKSVSETQTRNILGFPDATILKDSFGIYVADNIQKIQMVFIEKCSDSHSIRTRFQDFSAWLVRTSELDNLVKRAKSRKNIITAIAEENI